MHVNGMNLYTNNSSMGTFQVIGVQPYQQKMMKVDRGQSMDAELACDANKENEVRTRFSRAFCYAIFTHFLIRSVLYRIIGIKKK